VRVEGDPCWWAKSANQSYRLACSSYVPLLNSGRHIQALILKRADGRSICGLALARLTLLRKLNRYKVVCNVFA